ncbi:uncharacterized protein [Elaeis guineensis]|uniref:uncharacterized protein n=1 Tax=Elaeis guineensis var. tenera TaxID=51953 RepID=UPI003C6D9558
MGHPCEDGLEEEREVTEEVVVIEIDVKGDTRRGEDDVVVEIDAEFKPIDHLLQPPDADRTAKWPMPGSSLLHVGGTLNESYTESLWKKTESLATNEERTAQQSSAQTDRKSITPLLEILCPHYLAVRSTIFFKCFINVKSWNLDKDHAIDFCSQIQGHYSKSSILLQML